ncbi:hypothetical protein H8N03_25915 [Ramlibacter sp. USB13]|uniref:Uncharacterized protein n=1 Tax=Ramlibacter cellulosilyticus TaxID=2764187 RepID=A0A923SDY1_9BURK|nr:hypothetical protein [Ramlibacter cellulosilyticus]MBC5786399.1 hypothetical protein [Ramlibacter cellulosilyticus]
MTNSSLKRRLEQQASDLAKTLREPSDAVPKALRALAAQLELTVSSLERLSADLHHRGNALAGDLVKEAAIYEDGFATEAQGELRALREWLTEIPE